MFGKARWVFAAGAALSVGYAAMWLLHALISPDSAGPARFEIPETFVRFVRIVCDCGRPAVRGVVVSEHPDGSAFAIPGARFCHYRGSESECPFVRGEADGSGRFDLELAGETLVVSAQGCDPRVVHFEPEQRAPHVIRLDCPHQRAGPPEPPPLEASLIAW